MILSLAHQFQIPEYSSRFSKKKYSQHQLLALLFLKEEFSKDYRSFCEFIEVATPIREILQLTSIPHFTTLQKFLRRISSEIFSKILREFVKRSLQSGKYPKYIAIDATGITSDYASYYYSKRINKLRKSFIKLSIAASTSDLTIVGWKFSKTPVHDSQHAIPLIKLSRKMGVRNVCYLMDKGYDAEGIHQYIREYSEDKSVIPVRKWSEKASSGTYRREMFESFEMEKYRKRNLVETTFSVIKRRYSDAVRARKYWNQMKEIKIRLLLHNMRVV